VLVGLMGAGKSTVGRRLAGRLALPFVDADTEIEEAAGMQIADIFERFGEAYFRDGERRVIARLIDGTPKVIATGGGAFVNDETRALILDQATAVWLDADPAVLADRVRRRDTRPLLRGKDPLEVLTDLAAKRNPLYALAPIRVPSFRAPHEATVAAILEALGR
jgi:shikimate kinase